MLGAIIGDITGSIYEYNNDKPKNFKIDNAFKYIMDHPNLRMTDDSLLTIAVAKVLLNNYPIKYDNQSINKIQDKLRYEFIETVKKHPLAGFGYLFYNWCEQVTNGDPTPYNSYGNGAAMRISPVAYIAKSEDEVKKLSKIVTEITHNHPEGMKGAECIAVCIYKALHGATKEEIKEFVIKNYYPRIKELDYNELVANYIFNATCQGSIPEAIYCFLISDSLRDTIEKCILIGGDSDTIACIAGGIAEAYYQRDELSSFEDAYLYLMIDRDVTKLISELHKIIGSSKFDKKPKEEEKQ